MPPNATASPSAGRSTAPNRHDIALLEPTLDAVAEAGLLSDISTLHLDRGYDSGAVHDRLHARGIDQHKIQRRGTKTPGVKRQPLRLGLRWIVDAVDRVDHPERDVRLTSAAD